MDAVYKILPPVMFSVYDSEMILALYTKAEVQFLCVAFILAFSSAFQISAYLQHLIEFSFSRMFFVYLPLSNRAGLGEGDQSSAFRWAWDSHQNGVCLA